jgi:hypothetical protein
MSSSSSHHHYHHHYHHHQHHHQHLSWYSRLTTSNESGVHSPFIAVEVSQSYSSARLPALLLLVPQHSHATEQHHGQLSFFAFTPRISLHEHISMRSSTSTSPCAPPRTLRSSTSSTSTYPGAPPRTHLTSPCAPPRTHLTSPCAPPRTHLHMRSSTAVFHRIPPCSQSPPRAHTSAL